MSRDRKKSESKKDTFTSAFPVRAIAAGVAFIAIGIALGFVVEGLYRRNPAIDIRHSTTAAETASPNSPAPAPEGRP